MPYFSVIIPVYNKEDFIILTLQSVLNQTFNDFEIIIINDGSTDNSLKKILSIQDTRIKIYLQNNNGVSTARNLGLKKANGEYFCLLDADDIWEKNYLEQFYNLIKRYPEEHIFACAIKIQINKKTYTPKYYNLEKKLEKINYFKHSQSQSPLSSSSIVLKKQATDIIGYFDEAISFGEDTDYWIRTGILYEIIFLNTPLVTYTHAKNSLSRIDTDFSKCLNFSKFKIYEKQNAEIKTFLDNNRFTLAIKSKIQKNDNSFRHYTKEIQLKNLSLKRVLLLKSPRWIIILLHRFQFFTVKIGLKKSIFK